LRLEHDLDFILQACVLCMQILYLELNGRGSILCWMQRTGREQCDGIGAADCKHGARFDYLGEYGRQPFGGSILPRAWARSEALNPLEGQTAGDRGSECASHGPGGGCSHYGTTGICDAEDGERFGSRGPAPLAGKRYLPVAHLR
jgi:hypothetical protein